MAENRRREHERRARTSTRRAFLNGLLASSLGIVMPTRHDVLSRNRSGSYDFSSIRNAILAAVGSHAGTGIAVAVAHHGRIIWEEGFGWANREVDKVSEHTPFCLASITKPFTTTAIMTLVGSGKISLDDSANKYLGRNSQLQRNAEAATIRLLGAHAAGLPSMFEMYPGTDDARQPSPTTLLENYGTLAYAPNELYEYSNIGYAALGEIASNITGLEFAEVLKRQVLEPLGLHDSFFDTNNGRLANAAVLYDEHERRIPQYFTATPPSGELYASAHDLALFALFNLKHHLPDQAPILSDQLIDELHRPVFFGRSRAATTFGWFTGETKSGLPVIFKDGGQPGVSTIMYMVPLENLVCVALANRSDNGEFVQKLVDQIAATIIPNWTSPNTSVGLPNVDFPGGSAYSGKWRGSLHGGGAETSVFVQIERGGSSTLALGNKGPETITNLALQGNALVGKSIGTIESADAIRNHATSLSLKLLRRDDRLAGRILASAADPGKLAVLPYIVELRRSK
jgi:CubicO group peptidase (beta-lactamase class C family)